jgi:putative oxygen-independent coproporphyrinogen III oxidase
MSRGATAHPGPRPAGRNGRRSTAGVRHLYVHLPFCAHRCGYCDFVTVVGREDQHEAYVAALLAELALEHDLLADPLETVYLGGGTPTFTDSRALARLLAALPAAEESTVEANPETVTPELALLLRTVGVNRVSLGAQSFRPRLLEVLERRATPEAVRRAVYLLRDAGFDNISLDLVYGIPDQSPADLDADLADALELEPEHLSCYELEAKPGTRFTHIHGAELERQADAMEGYFEQVVDTLTAHGYRWYETANFCLETERAGGRDLRSRHNLAYWLGRDYLGLGIGAVSTVRGERRRNRPSLAAYIRTLRAGERSPHDVEPLDAETQVRERLLLGLRLDEPVRMSDVASVLDKQAVDRLTAGGLVELSPMSGGRAIRLTRRGRFLGGGVTAELMRLAPS